MTRRARIVFYKINLFSIFDRLLDTGYVAPSQKLKLCVWIRGTQLEAKANH